METREVPREVGMEIQMAEYAIHGQTPCRALGLGSVVAFKARADVI
jgi:hypothetical protein